MLIKHTHRLAPRKRAKKAQALPWSAVRARETTYLHSPSMTTVQEGHGLRLWPAMPAALTQPAKPSISHTHRHHSASCTCHRPGLASLFSICRYIPRQRFGNSMFPTPLVVLLRLLMPAASLSMACRHASRHDSAVRDPIERASAVGARLSNSYLRPRRLRKEKEMAGERGSVGTDLFAHLGWRVSVEEFLAEIRKSNSRGDGELGSWKVVSITWVKALASHMSHEFVQFVVLDVKSGVRKRLIADRQETGDWVSITPSPDGPLEMSDAFRGMGSNMLMSGWKGGLQTTPYKDRHTLPLPLVSIMFDDVDEAPTLTDMAGLLADVSLKCKEYNPLREHCWWFSEAVLHGARTKWSSARLEEWAWSRYRYSFVICNRWIRRKVLETAARKFEERCLHELAY